MKRFAIAAAALTLVAPLATTAAYADPGQYNGRDYSDHRDNNRNNDQNSYGQRGNDNRGGNYQGNNGWNNQHQGQWNNQYQGQHSWRRGDRLSGYDQSRFRSFDYRRDNLREPPRGYRYVQDDRGDTLLVGILSGVILSSILNNQGDRY